MGQKVKSSDILSINDQQKVMLDMMKAIHTFFVDNSIRYVMVYGTLLGAIRHKGFIPWDNDMDIGVPRPDYDRLLSMLNSGEKIGEHFYHLHYTTDDNYHYQIIRICDDRTIVKPSYIRDQPKRMGVWIDVFPYDGIPGNSPLSLIRRFRLYINKKIQIADIYAIKNKHDFLNALGNLCCFIFPHAKKRNELIDKILRKVSFNDSEYVADVEERNKHFVYLRKEDFDNPQSVEFEDTVFFAPNDWQSYLLRAYGKDFMQLPPPEKRMVHEVETRWV